MKRLLGIAVAGLAIAGAGGVTGTSPAHAENASQCLPVAPPTVPNSGVLAVAAGQPTGPVAVSCSMTVAVGRPLYWGARTANAWDIKGTRVSNGQVVVRPIASSKSVIDNGGVPAGNTFQAFNNETITVTIYSMCASGVCVAEGMAGVGG